MTAGALQKGGGAARDKGPVPRAPKATPLVSVFDRDPDAKPLVNCSGLVFITGSSDGSCKSGFKRVMFSQSGQPCPPRFKSPFVSRSLTPTLINELISVIPREKCLIAPLWFEDAQLWGVDVS